MSIVFQNKDLFELISSLLDIQSFVCLIQVNRFMYYRKYKRYRPGILDTIEPFNFLICKCNTWSEIERFILTHCMKSAFGIEYFFTNPNLTWLHKYKLITEKFKAISYFKIIQYKMIRQCESEPILDLLLCSLPVINKAWSQAIKLHQNERALYILKKHVGEIEFKHGLKCIKWNNCKAFESVYVEEFLMRYVIFCLARDNVGFLKFLCRKYNAIVPSEEVVPFGFCFEWLEKRGRIHKKSKINSV